MLTTWLEFENLKPEGKVQHMSVEKWQSVEMRVYRILGYGIETGRLQKSSDLSPWLAVLEKLFEAWHRKKWD